jgi:hypothetical protein
MSTTGKVLFYAAVGAVGLVLAVFLVGVITGLVEQSQPAQYEEGSIKQLLMLPYNLGLSLGNAFVKRSQAQS